MSGPKQRLVLSPAQTLYLIELVEDDLEQTELSADEKEQAAAILRKLGEAKLAFATKGAFARVEDLIQDLKEIGHNAASNGH